MSDGNGQPTFSGPGFGTLQQIGVPGVSVPTPRVVSQRATLRRALPPIYHDPDGDPSIHLDTTGNRDPFALRFVGALERVLDPIGAVLDTLPEQFTPDYATGPTLEMLASWIGVDIEVQESVATSANGRPAESAAAALEARRRAVRMAAELARSRGTAHGLKLALELTFPDLRFRIEDGGAVRWRGDGGPVEIAPPSFVVYVEDRVPLDRQIAIAQCIDRHKPVHAAYRLKVKKASD